MVFNLNRLINLRRLPINHQFVAFAKMGLKEFDIGLVEN